MIVQRVTRGPLTGLGARAMVRGLAHHLLMWDVMGAPQHTLKHVRFALAAVAGLDVAPGVGHIRQIPLAVQGNIAKVIATGMIMRLVRRILISIPVNFVQRGNTH